MNFVDLIKAAGNLGVGTAEPNDAGDFKILHPRKAVASGQGKNRGGLRWNVVLHRTDDSSGSAKRAGVIEVHCLLLKKIGG